MEDTMALLRVNMRHLGIPKRKWTHYEDQARRLFYRQEGIFVAQVFSDLNLNPTIQ